MQHLPSVYWQTEPAANVTTLFQYVYMETACCLAVQDPRLLWSKNTRTKVSRTTVVAFVLYEWKTWSLTWREEHRLRTFESRVLNERFGPDRDKVTGENCVMRSIVIFNYKILYRERIQGGKDGRSMWHTWERKVCSVWLGKIEEKRPL